MPLSGDMDGKRSGSLSVTRPREKYGKDTADSVGEYDSDNESSQAKECDWKASVAGAALFVLMALLVCLVLLTQRASCVRKVLFVLYDHGQHEYFDDIVASLIRETLADVEVLPVGPVTNPMRSAQIALAGRHMPTFKKLSDIGIAANVTERGIASLSDEDVAKVVAYYDADVIVTGMDVPLQLQLGTAIKRAKGKDAWFVAFYSTLRNVDAHGPIDPELYHNFVSHADEIWIPSDAILIESKKQDETRMANFVSVGVPMLGNWASNVVGDDEKQHREYNLVARRRHNLFGPGANDDGTRVLLWVSRRSGRDLARYRSSFKTWCQAIAHLSLDPNIRFLVFVGPGSDHYEGRVLKQEGLDHKVVLLTQRMPLKDVALASDMVVSQGSRFDVPGLQAVIAGKPSMFLDAGDGPNRDSHSVGVKLGLVRFASSVQEAVTQVALVQESGWAMDPKIVSEALTQHGLYEPEPEAVKRRLMRIMHFGHRCQTCSTNTNPRAAGVVCPECGHGANS